MVIEDTTITEADGAKAIGGLATLGLACFGGFIFFLDLPTFHANLAYARDNISSYRGEKPKHKHKPRKNIPCINPVGKAIQADLLEHWRTLNTNKIKILKMATNSTGPSARFEAMMKQADTNM